ncbi:MULTISPECIES: hypothetical protein [Streptomyces]|uniref:hypothetical protein n=1 Tax=Streptomyces TaxID=1883 RepID=UPI000B3221D0|nr:MULTISPECIES: hypothetical protein [Streptomyces]MDP9952809.1 hypothetical protein [Streptomyces sp. DSM 41269]
MLPHLGAQPLNAIGAEVLRHWKKRLEQDLGPTSIRLVRATPAEAKHRRPRTFTPPW